MNKLYAIGLVLVGVWWVGFTSHLDDQRMMVQYCWDSSGQHYVAPNVFCTH